ncbi:uncharacterized protein MONOS_15773 [Monocercomonoides exilis]|uniref:uncharacterized protein n=1 Tax=Monocercomonoides exilis TaxID=2049356 RepID=UPI00355959EC|nr:hypothetical protein MONOS_15773 [Monocercomonoides exilis]|eukprot:MONOS_15773.1-p1 / transcript=MONOS_15773.1 / gene=MONOS_15773 / organism=Monocercomonoides_exilis_PA203 / gene_product=unspecified product / transcript_product=unspecified product / location=Mono_scaffold01351:3859-5466(-) / protein_length=536 / sequence_SO=supercontig / SO=protein_coding / is_pseudo=false
MLQKLIELMRKCFLSSLANWDPSLTQRKELCSDVNYVKNGENRSEIAEFRKERLLMRWRLNEMEGRKREEEELMESESESNEFGSKKRSSEINEAAQSDECNCNRGISKKGKLNLSDLGVSPFSDPSPDCDGTNKALVALEMLRKRRLQEIYAEIKEAKLFQKMFGEWVEKDCIENEEERRIRADAYKEMVKKKSKTEQKQMKAVSEVEELQSWLKANEEKMSQEEKEEVIGKILALQLKIQKQNIKGQMSNLEKDKRRKQWLYYKKCGYFLTDSRDGSTEDDYLEADSNEEITENEDKVKMTENKEEREKIASRELPLLNSLFPFSETFNSRQHPNHLFASSSSCSFSYHSSPQINPEDTISITNNNGNNSNSIAILSIRSNNNVDDIVPISALSPHPFIQSIYKLECAALRPAASATVGRSSETVLPLITSLCCLSAPVEPHSKESVLSKLSDAKKYTQSSERRDANEIIENSKASSSALEIHKYSHISEMRNVLREAMKQRRRRMFLKPPVRRQFLWSFDAPPTKLSKMNKR